MATGFLQAGGRSITNDRIVRQYMIEDADDEDDVLSFVASLPGEIGGFPFADFSAEESAEIEGMFDLTVTWGASHSSQQIDTAEYSFSFQAPTGHIFQSLSTVASYFDPAIFPGVPPMHGAINVTGYGTPDLKAEGLQLPIPPEVFRLSYVTSSVSGAYQTLVEGLCGKVNSQTFRTKPAGSLMLVRVSGGRDRAGVWSIDFGFGYVANATGIQVGNITVPTKDGMDLLWTLHRRVTDTPTFSIVNKPGAVYIERVFERADLNQLSLPT